MPLDSAVDIALSARGALQEIGDDEARRELMAEGDIGMIVSYRVPGAGIIPYIAPRYRSSRVAAWEDDWRKATATAHSYLCSIGLTFIDLGVFGDLYLESAAQYIPAQAQLTEDTWHGTIGIGFSAPIN